jgi:hypothetical protein
MKGAYGNCAKDGLGRVQWHWGDETSGLLHRHGKLEQDRRQIFRRDLQQHFGVGEQRKKRIHKTGPGLSVAAFELDDACAISPPDAGDPTSIMSRGAADDF